MTKRREHIGLASRIAAALLWLTVAVSPGCRRASSHALAPAPSDADVRAIHATMEAQAQAWNRGDLHAFVAGYAESAERMTFVGSKATIVRGRVALEERYRKSYPEGQQGQLTFNDLEIRRVGPDSYLVLGKWALARPPDDPHGVFTLIFERGPHGLEIIHDHSSGAE